MIKAVLFDFDGTLADSSEGIFYTAISVMRDMGFKEEWPVSQLRKFVGPPLRECFKVTFDLDDSLCDEAVIRYSKIYREKGKNMVALYPGLVDEIKKLKALGLKIGLATNKTQDVAIECLKILGVDNLFDVVYGSDPATGRYKRETILCSVKALGIKNEECLMVGDTENDRDGALSAGVNFLAVTWGFGFSPSYDFSGIGYINQTNELYNYVTKLNSKEKIMIEKIETKNAPAAIGPYSQAVKVGQFLFASGQIPVDPATGAVVEGTTADQARQCFRNINAVLEAAGTDITKVVKATVFLKDMNDFVPVNEVYAEAFKSSPVLPARSAVQVAKLPKDVGVEIEVIALI